VNGTLISVVATGMGFAMVDLLLVQALAITEGPIYCVRFGTSGSISANVPVGCFAVTDKIYYVRQNYENADFPYDLPKVPLPLAPDLCELIAATLRAETRFPVHIGPGFSADTFYGSQGRKDDAFVNNNEDLITKILEKEPNAINFEMETYQLQFIASLVTTRTVKVGAFCITLAQRTAEGVFLNNDDKHAMEDEGARAILKFLSTIRE
jgi:uridine phosphorylase